MQFSSFGSFLLRCFAALSLVCTISCTCFASFNLEVWVDSLIEITQSYQDLVAQASKYRAAESSFAMESTDRDIERQGDEAFLKCLANRLLAEEYQPYDFDIRETFWCKGSPTADLKLTDLKLDSPPASIIFAESTSSFRSSLPSERDSELQKRWLPFLWLETFQTRQLPELRRRIEVQIENTLAYFSGVEQNDGLLALNEVVPIEQNEMQDAISLQAVFGSTVIPNSIHVTDADYATMAIQSWNEIQVLAKEHWELIQFRISQLRPISGFKFEDLAKSMLLNFRIARR